MKILIPPSEGKSLLNTSSLKFKDTNNKFIKDIILVLNKLRNLTDSDLVKTYGTSNDKSKKIHDQNLNLLNSKCSTSIERYTGVVYNNLNPIDLDEESRKFFNKNFLITSAMLGLVSPNEMIPFYKLKMNVLKLVDFWRPIFSTFLEKEDLIVDLLPEIHRKSYESNNILKINFYFEKNGKMISSGHSGKAIKGKYLRFIVNNQIEDPDDLTRFNEDGFIWDGKRFIKKLTS